MATDKENFMAKSWLWLVDNESDINLTLKIILEEDARFKRNRATYSEP